MSKYKLSEIQSKAIVEMRLRQLTGLEQDKLRNEYNEIKKLITDLKDILDTEDRRMEIITNELIEVRKKYGDERRSRIEYSGGDLSIEDMIPDEKVVITISHAGYIKRITSATKAISNNKVDLICKISQLVKLYKNGEPFKMSKRRGDYITVEDLIKEVGKDSVRFMMLNRSNDVELDFDFEKGY